jgi:outer membrane protein OmpA-like peptidoglycan-associated protein
MIRTLILFLATAICLSPISSFANPSQTGTTGLINVPTADTLDSGNLCVGVWGDFSKTGDKHAIILPVALTIGIGSFWEMYGSYPNILFNGQEELSGKGNVLLGTKLRFVGKRNSSFKLAADISMSRRVSENPTLDGITDVGGKLIASLKNDRLGMHIFGGYLGKSDIPGQQVNDELQFGGGVEISPTPRMKVTAELIGSRAYNPFKNNLPDYPLEALIGFQYYISPHLTFNAAGGVGFTDASTDWRVITGFSTCQGVGTYIKPVPSITQGADEGYGKPKEVIKPLKVIPVSPLLMKSASAAGTMNKIEIPIDPGREEIVIRPYGQIIIPPQPISPLQLQAQPFTQRSAQMLPMQRVPQMLPVQKPPQMPPVQTQTIPAVVMPVAETVKMSHKGGANEAGEIETPLYGVDVRGERLDITSAAFASIPVTMSVYRKFRFPDIMFDFGEADLTPQVKQSLSELAEQIRNDKKWSYLRIDAHTDSIGSEKYNIDLSLKRSISVASYLIVKEGIDPSKIFIKGMGKSKLIADNITTEGRRINRRFEILFLVPKE